MEFTKWLSTIQAKKASAAAKKKVLVEFQKRFQNADMRQFTTEVEFNKKHNVTGVEFKRSRDGYKISTRVAKRTVAEPCGFPWVSGIAPIS